jgi:hypothetical protein
MIRDGKKSIINAINNTKLPPCIVDLILNDIKNQVDILCKEEEQSDFKNYQKKLKIIEKNKTKNESQAMQEVEEKVNEIN